MPTLTNVDDSKAAKKAAAKASLDLARQWRDERRGTALPATKLPAPSPITSTRTNTRSRRSSTEPAPAAKEPVLPSVTTAGTNTRLTRRSAATKPASKNGVTATGTETPAPKRKTATKVPTSQYRKTPSRESRAEALAQARSKAREWNEQLKKGKCPNGDARFIPDLVETEVAEDVEALSLCADDFNSADNEPISNANAVTLKRNVALIKNDMKNVLGRMQYIKSENNDLAFIKNDIQNIYNRMQHLCETEVDADESREMDLD